MSWNHRVIKFTEPKSGDPYWQIHEVYYHEDGRQRAYTNDPIPIVTSGDDNEGVNDQAKALEDMRWTLTKMIECLEKPVLTPEDFTEATDETQASA